MFQWWRETRDFKKRKRRALVGKSDFGRPVGFDTDEILN